MDFTTFVFYFLSTILVLAGFAVITARNPVHAAMFLVLAFFSAAGIWVLAQAEFLAITLVLVYVGAVMVLFLFVVMMLDINLERLRQGFWSYLPLGAGIGLLMALEMSVVLAGRYFGPEGAPNPAPAAAHFSNTKELGRLLYTEYVYPFELASLILLVGLIAAIVLTLRKREDGTRRVDPAAQVAVKAADRMRVVQMPAEKEESPGARG